MGEGHFEALDFERGAEAARRLMDEVLSEAGLFVSAGLLYGPHEVLDVPARVPLRLFIELLRPPLGLLAGREASNLLLLEKHYRNHFIAGLFHQNLRLDPPSFCLLISAFTIPLGKGISVRGKVETPSPKKAGDASGAVR